MVYFQKMKSVLKCLSLSLSPTSFSLSHPFSSTTHPSYPGRRLPISLSGANHCNKFCSSLKKRQTFSFLTVFLTLLVEVSPCSWLHTGRWDVLPDVPAAEKLFAPALTGCP